jgi:hypothetical protein
VEIKLHTVPHNEQRYKTVGDWYENEDGEIYVTASQLTSWKREFLILVHELVEWGLCKNARITQYQVDKFDKAHEHLQDKIELGDMRIAPYRKQHCLATAVERLLAAEMDVVWSDYEEELAKLME